MVETKITEAFSKIDKDGSGDISLSELKSAASGHVDVDAFFKSADKDGSGDIDKAEFRSAFVANPKYLTILFNI